MAGAVRSNLTHTSTATLSVGSTEIISEHSNIVDLYMYIIDAYHMSYFSQGRSECQYADIQFKHAFAMPMLERGLSQEWMHTGMFTSVRAMLWVHGQSMQHKLRHC